jgi:small subunit ribosomal protein S1
MSPAQGHVTETAELNPAREDFASLLEQSFSETDTQEGAVVKGTVVGIEKDLAVIDVGLKTEGRVPLKEFSVAGKDPDIKVGDEVEVYLERIENALGEAVLSREKARREESWIKLEESFEKGEKVEGVIFNRVKGGFTVDLDGAVAFLPGSQVDIRPVRDASSLMHSPQPISPKARLSRALSRTSPTTARSSTWAASTDCCTLPTWRGDGSITRARSSMSAIRSRCRSSASTRTRSASASA